MMVEFDIIIYVGDFKHNAQTYSGLIGEFKVKFTSIIPKIGNVTERM